MNKFFKLFVPLRHEKKLQGESILFWVLVELGQKGVFGKSFKDETGVKMTGEQVGQGGFAGADVSFHRNKVIVHSIVNIRIPAR